MSAVPDGSPDPFLTLPLDGVHAIEASAGTGKTYTLATLVVRLVVEGGLRIGQVLAVTFTDAATQELRTRIRARLLLALGLANGDIAPTASPDAALTHAVIAAHLAGGGETVESLRLRLQAAAHDIDLAAIFTIHGFCARVLREHALEAGHGFDATELMTADAELRGEVAADLWRAHGAEADAADDLAALWPGGHAALADDLPRLVRERVLRPTLAQVPVDPAPRLHAATVAMAAAFRAHGDAFRASLVGALETKVLHATSYKLDWIGALFDSVKTWCDADAPSAPYAHDKLPQLTRETLRSRTSKAGAGSTPDSPVCDAVQAYLEATAAAADWSDARRLALLHRVRDDARLRIAEAKRVRRVHTYDDLIDHVADALDRDHGDALVARLRGQYAVALVDEFQDTDARQWRIFERTFGATGDAPALFVIGDPKQAIYGFRGGDLETYLAARARAVQAPPLASNFRSRPGVLRAIAGLYAQATASGAEPFRESRIRFHDVQPGGTRRDDDFLRDGAPAPALTVWRAPPPPDVEGKPVKAHPAGRSRELATQACVTAIHDVLSEARAGRATLKDGDRVRPVQPGDIAVLVRSHAEATRIRHALALAGIPAVAAGRQSLFATHEARDLHALLLALLHGADDGRLRMALSTVLVGLDAAHMAALDIDAGALHAWQLIAIGWRERLQRGGPLALVGDLCAAHAQRLLGLLDGERRLTNYMQLAELLQDAQAQAPGLHALIDWLQRRIASASADDDSQLLRLESDARRVQVVTLHKSKGLEYPLVFLPFAAIGAAARPVGRHVIDSTAEGRALHWNLLPATTGWEDAKRRRADADRAEDARLLYVGLTRARDALWVATGAFYNQGNAAIAPMLRDPDALATSNGPAVWVDTRVPPDTLAWLPPLREDAVPPARIAARVVSSDWWVHSFTQLAHSTGHADAGPELQGDASSTATLVAPGGRDEAGDGVDDAPLDAFDPRFSGARFGVVLHDALEHADFAQWRHWRAGDDAPPGARAGIQAAIARGGYPAPDVDDAAALITTLVGGTLTAPLPEGVRLADVDEADRRAEIEFQFALAPTRVDALLALLHRHGVLPRRQGFGARRVLDGLMTGLVDLTYRHAGRWYVLDYKSNRLPGYAPAQLAEAMVHSEYDLQALLYVLALHRWLRFRLGDGYDYARDFGGVRYVFCRGLDADQPGRGVHADRPVPSLVHALDALFAGGAA